jgi:hypothetical protein
MKLTDLLILAALAACAVSAFFGGKAAQRDASSQAIGSRLRAALGVLWGKPAEPEPAALPTIDALIAQASPAASVSLATRLRGSKRAALMIGGAVFAAWGVTAIARAVLSWAKPSPTPADVATTAAALGPFAQSTYNIAAGLLAVVVAYGVRRAYLPSVDVRKLLTECSPWQRVTAALWMFTVVAYLLK